MLSKFRVIVGGDQLTKVRFDGAANLRLLSATPASRFDHMRPNICELWHLKQDFLEKCFKLLYKQSSGRQEGTLSFFKNLLFKNDVTGKVKGKFESHSKFLKLITEGMIKEQAMEVFEMTDANSQPTIVPENIKYLSKEKKCNLMTKIADTIIDTYHYLQIDENRDTCNDQIYNYCSNLCTWGLHLLELDDTAKEGDINRIVPNLKRCIPFFYSHSVLSKYLVECIDYVLKVEYLLSPLDKMRVLEGSFINIKGGQGKNTEADLVQEHSVREQKELIKGLGANKTENAISTVTAAAPAVTNICHKFDDIMKIKQRNSHHSKTISSADKLSVQQILRQLRPFRICPGRTCCGFSTIKKNQMVPLNTGRISLDLNQIIERVTRGSMILYDDNDDDEDDIEDNNEDSDGEIPEIV